MTTQEAYDQMVEWFSRPDAILGTQGNGQCVYRGDQDPKSPCRCAIGCLIPDDKYDPEWDDSTIGGGINLWKETSLYKDLFAEAHLVFLETAQNAHDSSCSVPLFLERLRHLAVGMNLTVE